MKSIKEKAKESSLGYDEVQAPAIGSGFVLGANYVLECIELYCNEHVICNSNIKHLIEQLKK